jgi:hypothetical protein
MHECANAFLAVAWLGSVVHLQGLRKFKLRFGLGACETTRMRLHLGAVNCVDYATFLTFLTRLKVVRLKLFRAGVSFVFASGVVG